MKKNDVFKIKKIIFQKNGFFIFVDTDNNSFKGNTDKELLKDMDIVCLQDLKKTIYQGKDQFLFSDKDLGVIEISDEKQNTDFDTNNSDNKEVKMARVKEVKFHNTKTFIEEDPSTHSQWAVWKDIEGNKYSGTVNFLDFKKNTIFNADFSETVHPVYGTQRKCSQVEIIYHNTGCLEDSLRASGVNKNAIINIIADNRFTKLKDKLSDNEKIKEITLKDLLEVPYLGKKTAEKLLLNINKNTTSPSGSKELFFKEMRSLLSSKHVSIFMGGSSGLKSETDKIKLLDRFYKEFSKLLEDQNNGFFADTGVDSILKIPKAIEENPYLFIWINGFGFLKTDEIAREMGISLNSPLRQEAAVRAVLNGDTGGFQGDIYINRENLFDEVKSILSITDKNSSGDVDFTIDFTKDESDVLFENLRNSKSNKYFTWLEMSSAFRLVDKNGYESGFEVYMNEYSSEPCYVDENNNDITIIDPENPDVKCPNVVENKLFSIFKNGRFWTSSFLKITSNVSEQFTTIENYNAEKNIFDKVDDASNSSDTEILDAIALRAWILKFEKKESKNNGFDYKLSEEQVLAVKKVNSGNSMLFTLTGYAGTGKSTVSKALLELLSIKYKNEGDIQCIAVSGMASRRITEATGFTSSTVMSYLFDENRIKNTKVLFIDESSMIDSSMLSEIFDKIDTKKTRVLLVGDVGQLPSIGRGTPYKDILRSGFSDSVELLKIFRQSEDAIMTTVAKEIRTGSVSDLYLDGIHEDFALISNSLLEKPIASINKNIRAIENKESMSSADKKMVKKLSFDKRSAIERLNKSSLDFIKDLLLKSQPEFEKDIFSFQLISPQQDKGLVFENDFNQGHTNLNLVAQNILNPEGETIVDTANNLSLGKYKSYIGGHKKFRIGDKVVNTLNQNWSFDKNHLLGVYNPKTKEYVFDIKNSFLSQWISKYARKHQKLGAHLRIMNGMVGQIVSYNRISQLIGVEIPFENDKIIVFYSDKEIGSLSLAYALSVHKLQGSEAKTIAFVCSPSHSLMLNQNLLYTGLTRGKKMAYIIGSKMTFKSAIKKVAAERKTLLPLLFESKLGFDIETYNKIGLLDDYEHTNDVNKYFIQNNTVLNDKLLDTIENRSQQLIKTDSNIKNEEQDEWDDELF
jgi:ATP-dependent exoDNAse (exonuclease V) alpha subunit